MNHRHKVTESEFQIQSHKETVQVGARKEMMSILCVSKSIIYLGLFSTLQEF